MEKILCRGKGRRGAPPFWAALAALVLAGALAACSLTAPPAEEPDSPGEPAGESIAEPPAPEETPPAPEEQEKILEQVRAALDAYRDGTVTFTTLPNSDAFWYEPTPEGLALPQTVAYSDLAVSPDGTAGGFRVVLPSADGGWDIHLWVTTFSYDDGPPVWNWSSVRFIERPPAPAPEEQEKIVEQVRAALDAYRDGTVDMTIIPNSDAAVNHPKPPGLVLPEAVAYEDLAVYTDEIMGGFGVTLPSADGGWEIQMVVDDTSYQLDDGSVSPPLWAWRSVSFLERRPDGTVVWDGSDSLMYTALELVDGYFQALLTGGHGVPPSILDYTVKSITFMAGAKEEFAVSAVHTYTTAAFADRPSANGTGYQDAQGNWVWRDSVTEFRFRQKAGGGYELVSTGTGGTAVGLARPGTPTGEDIAGYLSILMDQVRVARAVYLAEDLPVTSAPAVGGFRMLDNEPALSPGNSAATEEARFYRSVARNLHTLEDVRAYLGDPFTAAADQDLWAQLFNDRYELYREIGGKLYVNGGVTPADRLGGDCDLDTLKILEQAETLIQVQLVRTRYEPETVRFNLVLEGGRWLLDETFYR